MNNDQLDSLSSASLLTELEGQVPSRRWQLRVVLTHFGGGDGLLSGSKRLGLKDSGSLLGHVGSGEVTESRVLGLRQKLVVGLLEGLGAGSAKNVLKVILKDHAGGEDRVLLRLHRRKYSVK